MYYKYIYLSTKLFKVTHCLYKLKLHQSYAVYYIHFLFVRPDWTHMIFSWRVYHLAFDSFQQGISSISQLPWGYSTCRPSDADLEFSTNLLNGIYCLYSRCFILLELSIISQIVRRKFCKINAGNIGLSVGVRTLRCVRLSDCTLLYSLSAAIRDSIPILYSCAFLLAFVPTLVKLHVWNLLPLS